jgi:hypothetical protein
MSWNEVINFFIIIVLIIEETFTIMIYICYDLICVTHPSLTWKTKEHGFNINMCWKITKESWVITYHMIKHESVESMLQWANYKGVVMDCCHPHFLINGTFQLFSCTLKEINYSFVSAFHVFDFIMHLIC